MSLSELMEPPMYTALTTLDELNWNEWTLTADAFIKFQVRRQAAFGAGREPIKKNIIKLLNKLGDIEDTRVEAMLDDTLQYMKHVLWSSELYVLHTIEFKDAILGNARASFDDIKDQFVKERTA